MIRLFPKCIWQAKLNVDGVGHGSCNKPVQPKTYIIAAQCICKETTRCIPAG